jgi:hypothetical protein
MDHIEERLGRIRDTIIRFSCDTSVPLDVRGLRAQISLRKIALKDIQTIRSRLRPLLRNRCGGLVSIFKPANRRRRNAARTPGVKSAR